MKITKGYKTGLDPNDKQRTALLQHAGAARFTFNWGLNEKKKAFDAKTKIPNAIELHRRLNTIKKSDFPWMYEVSKCSPQEALLNLDRAFDNFFRRCKAKKSGTHKGKVGFPKFKSKKKGVGSFRLTGTIKVFPQAVQLPRLGSIRLKERDYLPLDAKILSATISEHAGRWFVSIQVEETIPDPKPKSEAIIGIDLGIKTLATCSDGVTYENPKALRKNMRKLKRLSRSLHRKQKGSQNRKKSARKLAKLHYRIGNIRKDTIHKMTTALTTGHANCKLTWKNETLTCSCGAVIRDLDKFLLHNPNIMEEKLQGYRIDSHGGVTCLSKTQINVENICVSSAENELPRAYASAASRLIQAAANVQIAESNIANIWCNCKKKGDSRGCACNAEMRQKTDASPVQNVSSMAENMDKNCGSPLLRSTANNVPVVANPNSPSSVLTTSTTMEQNIGNKSAAVCTPGSRGTTIQQDSKPCAGTAMPQKPFSENVLINDRSSPETTQLTKSKSVIGIEDLNVSGMMKNHCLAQAISDLGLHEFRRQLNYKGKLYGCQIVVVDRFFPSSKMCNVCGYVKKDLVLSDKTWTCEKCKTYHDRDMNAALNLAKLVVSSTDSINACGEGSSGSDARGRNETTLGEARIEQGIIPVSFKERDLPLVSS